MSTFGSAEPQTDTTSASTLQFPTAARVRRRSGLVSLFVWLVILAVLVGGGYAFWPELVARTGIVNTKNDKGWLTQPVSRERLLITVTEDGNVESARNVDVKCDIAGGSTILWIVDDGTNVQEGDVIAKLDQAAIDEQLNAQKIVYEKALATKIQAEQDFEAAKIAVQEYEEGTYIQTLQDLEAQVTIAEENLRSAQNFLDHTQRMFRKGFVTSLQVEADEFAVKRSKLELSSAETARDVLTKFTKQKMIKELEAARDAAAARMRSEQAATDLEKARLDRLSLQLEKCIVKAPQAGMVVYANERNRRGGNDVQIEEGAAVREGQSIVKLPDLSRMQVVVKIHESKVEQVRSEMPARVSVQGREYEGHVVSVANQPESKSFFSSDVKEYSTVVAIEGETSKLKPGMTAEVEIFVADLQDELTVPVSAVVEQRGQFFTWVVEDGQPARRPVLLGPTNDRVIAIRDGITDGENVFLNPRAVIEDARNDRDVAAEKKAVPEGIPTKMSTPSETKEKKPEQTSGSQQARPRMTLSQLDKDSDGKLSSEEVPPQMKPFFSRIDGNGDGFVDAGEWAAMQKRAAQREQGGDAS